MKGVILLYIHKLSLGRTFARESRDWCLVDGK